MVKYENIRELFKDEQGYQFWLDLVEKTRNEIAEALKNYNPKHKFTCYIYNKDGQLVKTFFSKKECSDFVKGSETTVSNYLKNKWVFKGFLLSLEPLETVTAIELYKYNLEHGNVYLEGTTSKKKPIYCYNETGKLVALYESITEWSKNNNRSINYISYGDRIVNDRLVSTNKYSEEMAHELYTKLVGVRYNYT